MLSEVSGEGGRVLIRQNNPDNYCDCKNMQGSFILLASFATFAVCSGKVHWSEWRNATVCNGRPCGCAANKNDTCKTGYQIQVRICLRDGNTQETCKFDNEGFGSIRKQECQNGQEACPGWSEWTYTEECKCNHTLKGTRTEKIRHCNNPPPIHDEVQCWKGPTCVQECSLQDTGIERKQCLEKCMSLIETANYKEENCTCDAPITSKTTTTTTPELTTQSESDLPCCTDDYYGGSSNSNDEEFGGLFNDNPTPKPPTTTTSVYGDYFNGDYGPTCRDCPTAASNGSIPDYYADYK